jgi:hypothetical protein
VDAGFPSENAITFAHFKVYRFLTQLGHAAIDLAVMHNSART